MMITNPTELAPESDPLHWVDPPVLMYRPIHRPCTSSYTPSLYTALYTVRDPLHWVDPPSLYIVLCTVLVYRLMHRPCTQSCTPLRDPLHWVNHDSLSPLVWPVINRQKQHNATCNIPCLSDNPSTQHNVVCYRQHQRIFSDNPSRAPSSTSISHNVTYKYQCISKRQSVKSRIT
jgi:hypothetical protein